MAKFGFSGIISHGDTDIRINLQMYLFKEDDSFIVYCPALDLSAYGDTEELTKKAFEDVLSINIEYMMNKGTIFDDLKNHGWIVKGKKQRKIKAPTFDELLKRSDALQDIARNKDYTKYSQDVCISA
jgi:hypothetical protein